MALDPEDLNAVFSSMAEGLVVIDNQQRVEALNQAGGVFLRIAPKQAMGMLIGDLLKLYHIEHNEQILWPVERLMKLDITRIHIWDHIYCENKIGKLFPITMMATPLLTAHAVSGAVILFRDATDEARADQAKSDFVAVASHQLQTPLTAIKLFAEMLDQDANELSEGQRREYLQLLRSSTERMIKLVNEMLNVSRLEAGAFRIQPEPTDLVVFIKGILKELGSLAKERSCILTFSEPSESLGALLIDTALLSQVLFNLVENAMRYSTKNTRHVTIKLEKKTARGEYAIHIEDNGIGISSGDRKRIFTKFFRADSARKIKSNGSGLGLYVVKMIVEAWGGTISFTSQTGVGTVFSVTIPAGGMEPRKGIKQLIQT
ncbi:MAG: two-component system, OmpR family, sensor histidine kinase ResE [Parcubacteria group bacterium Gr01-1014_70]|nr:MAG: two-component system, OmpR family, sensor histidine kinase ResE [Parcubacteria group bacterium Gr01-1014_70]